MLDSGEIPPDRDFELVDGEIIWLTLPSQYHNAVIMAILRHLIPFADAIGARPGSEGLGFRLGQNLRAPDVSLILKDRLAIARGQRRWAIEAPDLAVEVLSPEQYGEPYARQKVPEYLGAGAKLVWLVNPETRTVRVFESGSDEVRVYSGDAEITLDQLAPGFRAPVSAFFPED